MQGKQVIYGQQEYIDPTSNITVIHQPNKQRCINNTSNIIWATRISGVRIEQVTSTITDKDNNIITIGIYKGDCPSKLMKGSPINFYNTNKNIEYTLHASENIDVFIVKYNSNGFILWICKITGSSPKHRFGITTDINNNIIVTGVYEGNQMKIYNKNNEIAAILPSSVGISSFIIKYNDKGDALWANVIITSIKIVINDIVMDNLNNIYISGYYNGIFAHFYNLDSTIGASLPCAENNNIFIAKYNLSGHIVWATKIDNCTINTITTNNLDLHNICVLSDGSVIISGFYHSKIIFYDTPNGSTDSDLKLNNEGSTFDNANIFIAKYSNKGLLIWTTKITNCMYNYGISIAVDSFNNIIITSGYDSQLITFYSVSNNTPLLKLFNKNNSNIFIAKYSQYGNIVWATKISGTIHQISKNIAIDKQNNILLTGSYNICPLKIYNSNDSIGPLLTTTGKNNTFLIKYDNDGKVLWAAKQNGISIHMGSSVSTDNDNNIILSGTYLSRPLIIHNSNGRVVSLLPKPDVVDLFIIKYFDYTQLLLLPSSLCCYIEKQILIEGYNGNHTLIQPVSNFLVDQFDNLINGIIFLNCSSKIFLIWENNKWIIMFYQDVILIYFNK